MFAFMGMTAALAQDWTMGADGGSEYNCRIVNAIVEDYGDLPYLRRDNDVQTLAELLAEKAPGCGAQPPILHTASPADGASLYARADGDCEQVEQLNPGDILDAIAIDDDWLTIRRGARRLYRARGDVDKLSLEMRIKDTTPTFQVHAGCFIMPRLGPGREMSVEFIIAGKRQEQVMVDLWPPGVDSALPIASREAGRDPHTGSPVIVQRYDAQPHLLPGEYIIGLAADGHRYRIAWDVTRAGPYRVNVGCE